MKFFNAFLLVTRRLNSDHLRKAAEVFKNLFFLVPFFLHDLRIELAPLRHELVEELNIVSLNLFLPISISVGL